MNRRKLVLGAVGALSLAVIIFAVVAPSRGPSGARAATGAGNTPPMPEVVVAPVERRTAAIRLHAVGNVHPLKSVQVQAQVDGTIQKVGFVDGQMVQAGDVLFEIDPRSYQAALKQAEGQQAQDQANLVAARRDLARTEALAQNGNATGQTLDQNRAKVQQLEAALKTDEGRIAEARVNLDRTTIRAPIAGRIGAAQMTEGNLVRASQANALTSINLLSPIELQFTLPQDRLGDVQSASARAPLAVHAITPDGRSHLAEGQLSFIDNKVDPATGTVMMKARFENSDTALWPGQFVNVELELEQRPNAVVVDSRAVQTGPNGRYVYIVRADQTIEARPVRLAVLEEGESIVAEGLQGGETVVIDGQLKVIPNAKVRTRTETQPVAERTR